MQERRHVKTIPGEPVAPEVVPHPVRKEEGGNVQMDDINIPLVAVMVAFFAVLLAVTIVSLQAWVYNGEAAEKKNQTLAQDDPRTEFGAMLAAQGHDLNAPPGPSRPLDLSAPATAPATGAGATGTAPRLHIPIEDAIRIVAKEGGV